MKKINPYTIDGQIGLTRHLRTPEVTMGHGALAQLGAIRNARLALIVDGFLPGTRAYQDLVENTFRNVQYRLICTVDAEPSYEAIDPYVSVIQEFAPTHIVALGGGSTIDTAKALWTFYERPELDWEAITCGVPIPEFPGKAELIAIPTTSGTGAEATGAAVYKKYDGSKALIIDQRIRPTQVYLDFDLVTSLPKKVVANAGVDALAHVIGALSMESINVMDKMICTQVAVTILKNLENSYLTGDPQAREAMHVCAYLAGDEINNAGGGLEHKLDMFAKAYHIPHGEVIGMFLPYTMLYLLPEGHYTAVAEQLGLPGETAEEKQRNLVERIWEIYDTLGMKKTIRDLGVPEEEFLVNMPEYMEMVKQIGHIYWIKGFRGDESLRQLYLQAYYGMD